MNIKGIHVSVDGLRINPEISNLLDKYKIVNYDDLNREIDNRNKEIFENYFLVTASKEFNKMILFEKDADRVYIDHKKIMKKVNNLNFSSNILDKFVKLSDLPIFKLYDNIAYGFIYGMFGKSKSKLDVSEFDRYNVDYVKDKMREFVIVTDAAVPKIVHSKNSIGMSKYNDILESINFYDIYVEKLLKKYPEDENCFYYKKKEKLFLVDKNKKEIFKYFNKLGCHLIIGDTRKIMKYLDLEYQNVKQIDLLYKKMEIISNYVTFDEALNITDEKVLNKFIVPYGKR